MTCRQMNEVDISHRPPLGVFPVVAGLGALRAASGYNVGNFLSTGPGFFPVGISGLLVVFGPESTEHIAAGTLKDIVVLGDTRRDRVPDLPTTAEGGLAINN